ncbi:MAG: diguanylate cyclase [Desulfobulbaceae bacterium]|nr:diguanylate cyclase [Desulfobulbaceae bacterium]
MTMTQLPDDLKQAEAFFEALKVGIVIANKKFQLLHANQSALKLLGRETVSLGDSFTCFGVFFGRAAPCDDCPMLRLDGTPTKPKAACLKRHDNGADVFLKIEPVPFNQHILITLQDVTREVDLLRKTDLNRKEYQAKHILLERRHQEARDEQFFLKKLLDHLPEALVTVDPEYIIEGSNQAVWQVLKQKTARTCYELFGYSEKCEECPAQNGFLGLSDVKKTHLLHGRYVTESISESPFGAGGLLLFRDTTRQIELIGKIKEQQQTIVKKNEILNSLAELGTSMQKESSLEAVIEFFLDLIIPLAKITGIALIVNDIRSGKVWFSSCRGLTNEQMQVVTKAYLSRNIQSLKQSSIDPLFLPWDKTHQLVLKGRNGALVGMILIKNDFKGSEEKGIIDLFSEPLGAYIDNRLLSKKLEEKANTDPLTGLYNRGYLEQAIVEEREKYEEFKIDYALVVADVNRLKKANDLYGHDAGDRLIMKVSEMLKDSMRSTDILARIGGDEFVILLTDSNSENAKEYIQRLTERVFLDVFIEVGKQEKFPVQVSFGSSATDVFAVDTLMEEADRAMYAAKEAFYQNEDRYR